jgi:hypothetical protein
MLINFNKKLNMRHYPKTNMNVAIAIVTLLTSGNFSIANAGVILEKKPQLKNYVEESPTVISKPKNLTKVRDEKDSKGNNTNKLDTSGSTIISPQTIALPGTILGIAGLAYLAYTIDSDFWSFVNKSSLRPSDIYGAGYEPELKGGVTSPVSNSRK